MTKTLSVVLIGVWLAVAPAQTSFAPSQRGGGDSILELHRTVELLEQRVQKLEAIMAMKAPTYFREGTAAADPAPARAPAERQPAAPGERPRNIMRLDGVESIEPDPALHDEIERLRREADGIENTVESARRRVTSAASRSTSASYRSYGSSRTIHRDRSAYGEQLAHYKRELGKKRGEIKKLERELDQPKQLIIGSWEGKVITLRTTRDVSRKLDRIEVGDYVTWSGRVMQQDEESAEWVVPSIDKVDPSLVTEGQ
jgi:hypothetical protein